MGFDFPIAVVVNRTLPFFTNVTLDPLFPTSQSGLNVTFRVHATQGEPNVMASAPNIDEDERQAECRRLGSGGYECKATFRVPQVGVQGSVLLDLLHGGTHVTYEQNVDTYTLLNEPVAGFIVRAMSIAPSTIDPRVLESTDLPVFVQLDLEPVAPDLQVATQRLDCNAMNAYLATDPYFLTDASEHPVFIIPLTQHANSDISVRIDCDLQLQVMRGRGIFAEPAIVPIEAEIPKLASFATPDDQAQRKLDDIDADIQGLTDDIQEWKKKDDFMLLYTSVITASVIVDAFAAALMTVYWTAAAILEVIGIGNLAWDYFCGISMSFHFIHAAFFWMPGSMAAMTSSLGIISPLTVLPSTWSKFIALIYSCKLCNYEDSLTLTTPQVESATKLLVNDNPALVTSTNPVNTKSFEPFRSMEIASSCKCIQGIAYNLEKERQLKCRQRSCIENHVAEGLPTYGCDIAYKDATCVYVDGAPHKLLSMRGMAIQLMMMRHIASNAVLEAGSTYFYSVCYNFLVPPLITSSLICAGEPGLNALMPPCRAMFAGLSLLEMASMTQNKYDWDALNGKIQASDFCGRSGDV